MPKYNEFFFRPDLLVLYKNFLKLFYCKRLRRLQFPLHKLW